MVEKKKYIDYSTKGPVSLALEDERLEQKSGTSVLDITFNEPVSIGEIYFRNHYTAYISVECRKTPIETEKRTREKEAQVMHVLIKHKVLMNNPHRETGSQDYIVLRPKLDLESWTRINFIRFILKQPSSLWRRFTIEDIAFYAQTPVEPKQPFMPRMFSATSPDITNLYQNASTKDSILLVKDASITPSSGSTNTSFSSASLDVAVSLQSLKNIVDIMKSVHTEGATVGRFEVDGSYDIDVLDTK